MLDFTLKLNIRPNGTLALQQTKKLLLVIGGMMIIFLGITLAVVSKTPMVTFDQNVADYLNESASSNTISIFRAITLAGRYGIYGLGVGIAAFFAIKQDWRRLTVWCGAIGGAQVINTLLKTLVARSRPVFEHPVVIDDGYGFPSGHSMLSVVAYGLLAYFIYQALSHRWQQGSLIAFTALIIGFIGLSRLILGVHFVSDVVAGYAIGIVWLSFSVVGLQLLNQLTVERLLQFSVQRTAVAE
jgi:undecaprenyl-diphosphatase